MVSSTGENLSVVITTEPGNDWKSFATWYSIFKNLPNSSVIIASERNSETPFQFFQWAKRLNVPIVHHNNFYEQDQIANNLSILNLLQNRLKSHVLLVHALTMSLSPLDQISLSKINSEDWIDENVLYLRQPNIKELLNTHALGTKTVQKSETTFCFEASEEKASRCLVSYKKGCGKWINKLRGCPFSNAAGLTSTNMTINEIKIVELWKRMCSLYSVLT